jgi:thiol-disulfide isomerase/thioredoxin
VLGRFSVAGEPPVEHRWTLNEAVNISTLQDKPGAGERKYYRCLIDKDGSFRADDIPPGRYELTVNLTAAPEPNVCGHGVRLGRIEREIELKEEFSVLDLGVIEGSWFKRLGKGDPAPEFITAGLDDEPIRLRDLRGRVVLIDFWATWCRPCMAEMPRIVELHQELGKDARFQILGLSVDNAAGEAKGAVEKNGWPWLFAFAGPGMGAAIPGQYDVQAIPEKFLVDIDGTILYRGRDLEEVARLARQRLSELPR